MKRGKPKRGPRRNAPRPRRAAVSARNAASTTASYARLVITSSNFPGRELALTRTVQTIGRTDENDLVIKHGSVSRRHARIARNAETGRYTIADLHSTNGVRVNGQDYNKVELRRGDDIDLGHVRMRFVESDEDFVFVRDVLITVVPEPRRKRRR